MPELADMPLSVDELEGVGEGVVLLLLVVVVGSWIWVGFVASDCPSKARGN